MKFIKIAESTFVKLTAIDFVRFAQSPPSPGGTPGKPEADIFLTGSPTSIRVTDPQAVAYLVTYIHSETKS